jgi:hypothetical protein
MVQIVKLMILEIYLRHSLSRYYSDACDVMELYNGNLDVIKLGQFSNYRMFMLIKNELYVRIINTNHNRSTFRIEYHI